MLNKISPLLQKPQKAVIILLTAGFLAVAVCAHASAEKVPQNDIIARVNGAPIHGGQITAKVINRMAQYRQMGSRLPEEELKRQLQLKELDALIAQELLSQAGAAVDIKEVEQRLEKRLSAHVAAPGAPADRDKLRKEIQQEILLEKKGIQNLKVDEQEMRAFYEKNLKSFHESRSIKAQHILVRVPSNATTAQEQGARRKAAKTLSELKKGKDFAETARTSSDCSSKETGGDLGVIKEGYMPREFDAAAFKLKPGEISDIVKTRYGFHILRIAEHFPARQMSFSEVKEHIANYLKMELQRKKIDELVQQLKNTAKIEILI